MIMLRRTHNAIVDNYIAAIDAQEMEIEKLFEENEKLHDFISKLFETGSFPKRKFSALQAELLEIRTGVRANEQSD